MHVICKICYTLAAIIICVGAVLVTIVALFAPKEYKGDGKLRSDGDKLDESIEDV